MTHPDETPANEQFSPAPESQPALTPLDPRFVSLTRIRTMLAALPFVIAAIVAETTGYLPLGLVIGPVLLVAGVLIVRLPHRRYIARGFSMGEDRLRVVRGLWFRHDTVVPFGRVQHIDVEQGPLERLHGLATLTVHTAGTHNASVHQPGLAQDDAAAMRETIRRHIKRELR